MKKQVSTLLLTLLIGLSFIPAALTQKKIPDSKPDIFFDLAIPDSLRSTLWTDSWTVKDLSSFYKPDFWRHQTIKTPIELGIRLNPATYERLMGVKFSS